MYIVSDGWMTNEKDREGSDQGLIKALSQDLMDSLKKTQKTLFTSAGTQPRFQLSTSKILA
jgi:hypothetical protein